MNAAATRRTEHLEREIYTDHMRAARRREFGQIASSAGEVDHTIPLADAYPVQRIAAPALIESGAQQPIELVVARRDPVEHRAHTRALLFERRQGIQRHVTSTSSCADSVAANASASAPCSCLSRNRSSARPTSVR